MAGIPNWFVIVMGLGTTFVGLICIILLCSLLGVICKSLVKEEAPKVQPQAAAVSNLPMPENKQEILAAVCAVIAEELGTEVEALKVVSFKRV